jgi:acyl-CoA synthetase (AMP-forming)/AMP-acid ligase II
MTIADDRAALVRRWYEQGHYTANTFADEFRLGAAAYPETRIVFESETRPGEVQLAALHERGTRLASALASLGLRPGDAIACQVPNWLEGALVYHAALTLGLIVVPIIHIYGPAEVSFILRQSGARTLVMPARWRDIDYVERLRSVRQDAPVDNVIVIGDEAVPGAVRLDELEASGGTAQGRSPLRPEGGGGKRAPADEVCMIVYTSGTTAEPKGVLHTHNSLLAEIRTLNRRLASGPTPVVSLSPFPAGHMGGVLGLGQAFLSGWTTVLMDRWNAARASELIERHQVTSLAATTYFMITLREHVAQSGRPLPSLREIHVGGAGVPAAAVEAAQEMGWAAFRSYGMTEHPTVTAPPPGAPLETRSRTDGPPLPGSVIRIVDEGGADVPTGTAGEVAVIGPEQFAGYRDPALDADAFLPGGWLRTGDVGILDEAGRLTIVDRKKDIIIRGGENISSQEVEAVLARHPAVSEAAVTPLPDPRYGERVCAFVVLLPGATLTLQEVRTHFIASGVAMQKAPERLEIVAELPRTATGKVRKADLRSVARALGVEERG